MKSQERIWEDILISSGLGMGVGLLHSGRLVYGTEYRDASKPFDYSDANKRKDRRGLTWIGRKHTEAAKEKNRRAHLGRKQSPETIKQKSESMLAYYASRSTTPPEIRAKQRAYMAKHRAKRKRDGQRTHSTQGTPAAPLESLGLSTALFAPCPPR
jgi:hypothetical protein